jgi:hypothetical protein
VKASALANNGDMFKADLLPWDVKPLEYLRSFYDTAAIYLSNHTFIVTRKGYTGLAPWRTKPGDLICKFPGLSSPFILRFENTCSILRSDDVELQKMYEFIGPAYVHRILELERVQAQTGSRKFYMK